MRSFLPRSLARLSFLALAMVSSGACRTLENRSQVQAEIAAPVAARWTSEGGNVLLNGKVFHLKGANWYGLETREPHLGGLSQRSMASILDWLVSEQFNSLRIPISVQWTLDYDHIPSNQQFTAEDADLRGKPWVAILDKLVAESSKRGIVIMLDMHTIEGGDNLLTKRWYSDRYSVCDFREAWQTVLDRFGHHWNIFALDLKNELHNVDWGTSVSKEDMIKCHSMRKREVLSESKQPTDWRLEVMTLVPELAIPRQTEEGKTFTYQGLYLVQGMHHGRVGDKEFPYGLKNPFGYWFGGNLEGLRKHKDPEPKPETTETPQKKVDSLLERKEGSYPIAFESTHAHLDKQIAYTIHVYGPSVHVQSYFEEYDAYRNPARLDTVFETQNGFIEEDTDRAVIIGEWGGVNDILNGLDKPEKKGKDDKATLSAIANWFPENCMADAFWWAINPESADTGGMLTNDYKMPLQSKLDQARKMMPKPTRVRMEADGQIRFVEAGAFHPACKNGKRAQRMPPPDCSKVNEGGISCFDLSIKEGETVCKWKQQWVCKQGCAVWQKPTCEMASFP